MKKSLLLLSVSGLLSLSAAVFLTGCKPAAMIRLNQVGYAPGQEKTATIVMNASSTVHQTPYTVFILNENRDTVWTGNPSPITQNPISGKPCRIVDFSALTTPGAYQIVLRNRNTPIVQSFVITDRPYRELTRQALRAYYHQRASMATVEPYAEGYARPAGHPDDRVLVHASAATAERPEGTVISCPGGWYDAGDYNKYIVNSGFTMGVWLMAYEMNKSYFDTLSLNIPESVHRTPDMLEEAMYNLRWMMTMQDLDGGVYHKLTEPDFEGFIAPHKCRKPRYVVLKTTAAALDFAATMALAARVYAPYEKSFPGFPGEAADAAIRAYQWAEKNPRIYYDQPAINEKFAPAINTGAYDDTDVRDEFLWAATELYLLTGDEKYKSQITHYKSPTAGYQPAVWGNVWELAYLEQAMRDGNCDALLDYLKPLLDEADRLSVFRSPYGNRESDFFWGCNSEGCCWRGIECLYAYRLTGDDRFLRNAARCLDYVLGQNATGYCYVTGFGTRPTSHPHHRLSYSHPKGTIPGFLAGGPNPAQQDAVTDGVRYPKNVPADESYLDKQPSYASNEVTINWNVTLFALTAGLDALSHP